MRPLTRLELRMLRSAAAAASQRERRGSLVVLMYHRVLQQSDPMLPDEPDAARFGALMDAVRGVFEVRDLADAAAELHSGSLPARTVAITFDDGYANNLQVAAPILAARGLPATCFVATGHRDGSRMWNDVVIDAIRDGPAEIDLTDLGLGVLSLANMAARRAAAERLLQELKYVEASRRRTVAEAIAQRCGGLPQKHVMMTDDELRQLSSMGVAIGAHCISHPILTRLTDEQALQEIAGSRQQLESVLQGRVRSFAYPNGRPGMDFGQEHVGMVRTTGFECAVTTAWGAASAACDLHQLPRIAPWDRSPLRYVLRIIRAFTQRRPARI